LIFSHYKIWLFFLLITLIKAGNAYGQEKTEKRIVQISSDTLQLDSLSIVPESFNIRFANGEIIDTAYYRLEAAYARLIIRNTEAFAGKEVEITYITFPFLLTQTRFRKSTEIIQEDKYLMENPFRYEVPVVAAQDLFPLKGLDKSGSIARGISFGNNQDVIMNSSMNLQVSGPVGEGLQIMAAITDQNIPIQPDGTTQQLQDFDRVFIKLFNDNNALTAGDFELYRPEKGYFMNLNKKLQGLHFSSLLSLDTEEKPDLKHGSLSVNLAGAVSKGKFSVNRFDGIEGNQGPYKLRGNNNESYIIVLAGTEKVYIDGKLLTRGLENDYVIDYNSAEVRFTAQQPITRNKRILIEFEYSEKSYTRSSLYGSTVYRSHNQKMSAWLNVYNEQDAKNQPVLQELSEAEKEFLWELGDDIDRAWFSGVDSLGFDAEEIRYEMTDTLVNGIAYDSVFVFSTNPEQAVYRLVFAFVGKGNGNYNQKNSAANGRVFEWVAPENGTPKGSYEPVKLLQAPALKRLITAGAEGQIGRHFTVNTELAASTIDKNLFSPKDANDNNGYAAKSGLLYKKPMKNDSLVFLSGINYEFTSHTFEAVERYRSAEHARDWNIGTSVEKKDEHWGGLFLALQSKNGDNIRYDISAMHKPEQYDGVMHTALVNKTLGRFRINYNSNWLHTTQIEKNTAFNRHRAEFSYRLPRYITGFRAESDKNTFWKESRDSLHAASFSFQQAEAFIRTPDTSKTFSELIYRKRYDHLPLEGLLQKATESDDVSLDFRTSKNPNHRFSLRNTYRRLEIADTSLSKKDAENTVLSRIDYTAFLFDRMINANIFYEAGAGMEMKRSISYVEVAQGMGAYSWTDYNGNGVKELDEFEVAAFKDQANYIRVFIPSEEFERVYANAFQGMLHADPSRKWKNKGIISRFSNRLIYRVDQKTTISDMLEAYNPFTGEIPDTSLITSNTSVRNTLFFNRNSPKFGADFSFQESYASTSLYQSAENRFINKKTLDLRWNIHRKLTFNAQASEGVRVNRSQMFSSRNFSISQQEVSPSLSFQPNRKFRTRLIYRFAEKNNRNGETEKAVFQNAGLEIRYSVPMKGSLQLRTDVIFIDYNGESNTPVAFEMMEGLNKGQNITWNMSYQRNIAGNLQMLIGYEGRKPDSMKMIHIGNVQLRAFF